MSVNTLSAEEYINALPLDTTHINVNCKGFHYLPDLSRFTKLTHLRCVRNHLTVLPRFPDSIQVIDCAENKIVRLPSNLQSLTHLDCSENRIDMLPVLSPKLLELICYSNNLQELPVLPTELNVLDIAGNRRLTNIPKLPDTLEHLDCRSCSITELPEKLPQNLSTLLCSDNKMTQLPILPTNLTTLTCEGNKLNMMPFLPLNLKQLYFGGSNPIYWDIYELKDVYGYGFLEHNFDRSGYGDEGVLGNEADIHELNEYIWMCREIRRIKFEYYCKKYRGVLLKRLWKIREPKIRSHYSPENLMKLLNRDMGEDYDEFNRIIDEW